MSVSQGSAAGGGTSTRDCPFCMEQIKAEAIKCKYCGSTVQPEDMPHGGTCPYCKETINPKAVRCKHCKSNLGIVPASASGNGPCGGCVGCRETAMGPSPVTFAAARQPIGGGGGGQGDVFICNKCKQWVMECTKDARGDTTCVPRCLEWECPKAPMWQIAT